MEAEHGLPRDLLTTVVDMFGQQRAETRFDLWLKTFMEEPD